MAISPIVYLDHAATTPLATDILDAMLPILREHHGNASSAHRLGRTARGIVESCRERISVHLSCKSSEIIFVSGGTEADNTALRGVLTDSSMGLLTGATEHEAVLQTAAHLQRNGHTVITLPPGQSGTVTPEMVREAIVPGIRLVSIAYVNNETGAVARIPEIARVCHDNGVLLHTDAVQAASTMDLDVGTLGVDLLTLSGHKMYGPKGIGVVYVRDGVEVNPFVLGGSQEGKRRAGTENVAAIAGMAEATDLVTKNRDADAERIRKLRARLQEQLLADLDGVIVVNTPTGEAAAPHILNIAFLPVNGRAIDGAMLLLNLDLERVMVSAGSACSSGAVLPSHVLLALGLGPEIAGAAIRFSLGRNTTEAEIDRAAASVVRVVTRMRGHRTR